MKNLYLLICTILLCYADGYSQNSDYIKQENTRLIKARKIESDIEKYITLNLKSYTLTSDKEYKIKEAIITESRANGEILNDKKIEDALTDAKKSELRNLYFKNNPGIESLMKATPIVYTVPADCNNGDFEQGLAGYTFTRRSNTGFDILNCEITTRNAPFFNAFIPSINNFNTEGATLVTQPGFDPSLLPFNIQVPMIHSGNSSIKLNRSTGGTDITTMTSTIRPSTNEIGFYYSLIVENPHPDIPADQPFFTVRIYRDNQIVNTNNICLTADVSNPLFFPNVPAPTKPSILYTDWLCDRIKIPDEMVGLDLILEFVIADCGQGGHFGTVYIDDICDTCERPGFGSIQIDNKGFNCPTTPFNVCGLITMPVENNGNPTSVTLNVVEESTGQIVNTYTNVIITNPTASLFERRFCFTVDPSIYPNGEYTFVAIANFGSHEVSDFGATNSIDLSFNSNAAVLDSFVVRGDLFWTDSEESYDLEFLVDSVCCPNSTVIDPIPAYYATTVTENHINLYSVAAKLNYECFRWRIKTSCGWSEWCCLTTYFGYDFPSNAYWGNAYEPACYDGSINLCEPFLYEADPVAANSSQFEQREQYITAVNIINNNANVMYQAGNYVELLPNFNALNSSVFTAQIEECVPQTVFTKSSDRTKDDTENTIYLVKQSAQPNNGFNVYPNPTEGMLSVRSDIKINLFTITDMTGKEIKRISNNQTSGEIRINISEFPSGIYLLSADGQVIQKIIKN